jgi:hypothetical protein
MGENSESDAYDRATPDQKERYLELMRHDPVAGMAYLDALGIMQQSDDL